MKMSSIPLQSHSTDFKTVMRAFLVGAEHKRNSAEKQLQCQKQNHAFQEEC